LPLGSGKFPSQWGGQFGWRWSVRQSAVLFSFLFLFYFAEELQRHHWRLTNCAKLENPQEGIFGGKLMADGRHK